MYISIISDTSILSNLLNLLSSVKSFSEEELSIIQSKFHSKVIKKHEFLLKDGAVCNDVALIQKGSLVLSQTLESGSTMVLDFFTEGDLVADYYSFLKKVPALTDIQAIQNSTLLVVNRTDIIFLLDTIPNFQKFRYQLAEQSFIRLAEKIKQSGLSPSEKYALLRQNKPEVIEEFPQYMIASYLGISPEWLSKLRARK